MSRHTPFIVVPRGAFTDSYIYKCRDSEDPVYDKYAEGSHKNMVELANQLNYIEAEAQFKVATERATESPELVTAAPPDVGIPTEDKVSAAERTLRRIQRLIEDSDRGVLNLVDVKNHIHNELVLYRESPVR